MTGRGAGSARGGRLAFQTVCMRRVPLLCLQLATFVAMSSEELEARLTGPHDKNYKVIEYMAVGEEEYSIHSLVEVSQLASELHVTLYDAQLIQIS